MHTSENGIHTIIGAMSDPSKANAIFLWRYSPSEHEQSKTGLVNGMGKLVKGLLQLIMLVATLAFLHQNIENMVSQSL